MEMLDSISHKVQKPASPASGVGAWGSDVFQREEFSHQEEAQKMLPGSHSLLI